jgi:DNA-binding transcriptional MerR regulator
MPEPSFPLNELSVLVDTPARTIRYYIQLGLVERPRGETRAARYSQKHVEALLQIKRWSQAGLSLEAIRDLIEGSNSPLPPAPPRRAGSVEVWSHLLLADGVEIHIEPGRAGLTPEQLRELQKRCLAALAHVKEKQQ